MAETPPPAQSGQQPIIDVAPDSSRVARKRTSQSKKASLAVASQPGAYVITQHINRKMRIYPLSEAEVKSLALLHTASTGMISLGCSLLTFCIGLRFDLDVDPAAPGKAVLEAQLFFYTCIPLGLIFLLLGFGAAWYRRSELKTILDQTEAAG